jgi:hypothetical protein
MATRALWTSAYSDDGYGRKQRSGKTPKPSRMRMQAPRQLFET